MKEKKTIKIKKTNMDKILFAYHSLVNAEAVVADLIFSKRESFYKLLVKNGMNPDRAKMITFCRADGSDAAEKWLKDLEAEFECV